jgi:tRNA pseudouridine38-40 synthase
VLAPAIQQSHDMRTFKLTLAYDGSNYSGWQIQPQRVTLQQTLESALRRITGQEVRVTASGRTDAGVHALGQVVSFRSATHLPPDVFRKALNAELPHDMAARSVELADDDFHATGCAKRKRYRYLLDDGAIRDVFQRRYVWHLGQQRLDEQAMQRAAQALRGTHDFRSFETHGSERETSVRTIFDISVSRAGDRIALEVEADGFLYNMVRTIVGTLVEVGRGRRGEDWVEQVLAARDRKAAGQTAPPQGLVLVQVEY